MKGRCEVTYQPKTKQVQRDAIKQFFAATKSGNAQWWTDEVSAAVVDDLAACEAELANEHKKNQWKPIETAPKDGTKILVWCPSAHGLDELYAVCAYHEDAGFCVCELREPTHWQPLPQPPERSMI